MRKTMTKAAALTLALVLSAGALSGCSGSGAAKDIYTLNGEKVDKDLTEFAFRYDQAMTDMIYGQMYLNYFGQDIWDMDATGSGQPYSETFKQEFGEKLEKLLLANDHASEYGVELTDDEKAKISEAADAFMKDNSETVLKSMGAAKETVEKYLTMCTVQTKVEKEMTKDVDTEVPDEEAAQRTVSYIEYTPTTETEAVETEAELPETEAEIIAAEVMTEGETGPVEAESEEKTKTADTEAAAADETEAAVPETEAEPEDPAMAEARVRYETMAEDMLGSILADEISFDDAKAEAEAGTTPGVYASVFTFGKEDDYPEKEIIEATNDLMDDEMVDHVVKAADSYYLLRVDKAFDEEATQEKKDEIVAQRKLDKINEIYTEWLGKADWKVDEAALAALKIDRTYQAPAVKETDAPAVEETEIQIPETETELKMIVTYETEMEADTETEAK